MTDRDCPNCGCEFESPAYINGYCPDCKLDFTTEEDCLEDYTDCWETTIWDSKRDI